MLGHLVEWHFAYVAGIRQQPGSAGWKKILIAPQPPPKSDNSPNAIRSAKAVFDSPGWRIASNWEIDDANGEFRLTCTIPGGVEAMGILPDESRHALSAGTTVLRQALR